MNKQQNALVVLFSLLQLGANLAVLSIIPLHLNGKYGYTCLLSDTLNNDRPCNYGYILAGVGTGMSIVFASLTYCNTAIINSVKAIFFCIISAWYAAGAGILTLYAISANENNVPAEEWRTAVWALLWGNLGLTVLMAAANDFIGKQKNIAIENNV